MKYTCLPVFCAYLFSAACVLGQPRIAWVARYNGGFDTNAHVPLEMQLDGPGNIYIAGSSRNADNLNDYMVLKYAPNGQRLYAARYSSTNGTSYTARGFDLDQNGSTYITGEGGTVKFGCDGEVVWTTPYAGRDVAVDKQGNVYVTGFSMIEYATVKLDAMGSNQWVRTYQNNWEAPGEGDWPTESQKVAVDTAGRVFVAGMEPTGPSWRCGDSRCRYYRAMMLMYETTGNSVWTNTYLGEGGDGWADTIGLIPDDRGNIYVMANQGLGSLAKLNFAGERIWATGTWGSPVSMAIDANGDAYLAGNITLKFLSGDGLQAWWINDGWFTGYGIALDVPRNVYVTGLTNQGAGNDIGVIKYDNNGDFQWFLLYDGPANGNDVGTAIAVAPDGAIYVCGYSENTAGGSDITLIKYAPPAAIEKKSDGSIQIEAFGVPGQSYTLQGTTNFSGWKDLSSSIANTNGVLQFTDPNAPLFPYRFYRWYLP